MSLKSTLNSYVKSAKNLALQTPEIKVKVYEATNNEKWGPKGSQMQEIAEASYSYEHFPLIMEALWERMNDAGKFWRHVYKSLLLLEYLLRLGDENCIREARVKIIEIQTLREFQHIDDEGKDQGANVRQKAKHISELLHDEQRLRAEREKVSCVSLTLLVLSLLFLNFFLIQAKSTVHKFDQAISSDSVRHMRSPYESNNRSPYSNSSYSNSSASSYSNSSASYPSSQSASYNSGSRGGGFGDPTVRENAPKTRQQAPARRPPTPDGNVSGSDEEEEVPKNLPVKSEPPTFKDPKKALEDDLLGDFGKPQQNMYGQGMGQQGMMQSGMGQQGMMQPGMGMGQQGMMQPGMGMGMGQQGMMQPGMMQPGMGMGMGSGQQGMMRPGMGQQGMMQPGMGQQGMMQPGMGQQGMMQPGMGMGQQGMMQPGMGMGQQGMGQQGMGNGMSGMGGQQRQTGYPQPQMQQGYPQPQRQQQQQQPKQGTLSSVSKSTFKISFLQSNSLSRC